MTKKLTPEEKAANLTARRAAAGKPEKKAKAAKPAKAAKKAKKDKGDKVTSLRSAKTAGEGHNSGETNEALKEIFSQYRRLDEDGKVIAKAKRDLRAKAKEEHNIMSSVFNHEVKLQKLDHDQRVMFEEGCKDIKTMLGIQLALDLQGGSDDEDEGGDGANIPDPVDAGHRAAGLH